MRVLMAFLAALWRGCKSYSSILVSIRSLLPLSPCPAHPGQAHPNTPRVECPQFLALTRDLKSINWHLLRECNYNCGFCYHVNRSGPRRRVPLEEAKRGLRLLVACGMEKINFSGGEPFLEPQRLASLCRFIGEELRPLDPQKERVYVSIITNGSLVTEAWIQENHRFVDMIGVSVDSCSDDTHQEIGRYSEALVRAGRYPGHLAQAFNVSRWCHSYGVKFKVNTVVNHCNANDDMTEVIRGLDPARWKVFELLEIQGENSGEDAPRNGTSLKPSHQTFQCYVDRHHHLLEAGVLVVEDNHTMRDSYVILDEEMRFLDNSTGSKVPSGVSILDHQNLADLPTDLQTKFGYLKFHPELLPVALGFSEVKFDSQSFKQRRGDFFQHPTPTPPLPDLESLR